MLAEHAVPGRTADSTDRVTADPTVTLGSPTHRASMIVPNLRRITRVNTAGEPLRLITARVDLPATTVVTFAVTSERFPAGLMGG